MNKDTSENRNMCISNRDYWLWYLHIDYEQYFLSAIENVYTTNVIDVKVPILQILTHDLKPLQTKD